jgi:hypothetical protein
MTEFRLLQPQKSLSQYKYYASTDTMFNFMWIYVLISALRSLFDANHYEHDGHDATDDERDIIENYVITDLKNRDHFRHYTSR